MSAANRLFAVLKCSKCGVEREFEIEVELGHGGLLREYRIGDEVEWSPRKHPRNGGQPADGSIVKEGYSVCDVCEKDFFVRVVVEGDRIIKVEPDDARKGYIP